MGALTLQGCCFPFLRGMPLQHRPESPGFAQPPWSWQLQLFTLALECLGTELLSGRAARLLRRLPAVEIPPWPVQPAILSCSVFRVVWVFFTKKVDPLFLCHFLLQSCMRTSKFCRQSQPGSMLPWEILSCGAQRNDEIFTGRI